MLRNTFFVFYFLITVCVNGANATCLDGSSSCYNGWNNSYYALGSNLYQFGQSSNDIYSYLYDQYNTQPSYSNYGGRCGSFSSSCQSPYDSSYLYDSSSLYNNSSYYGCSNQNSYGYSNSCYQPSYSCYQPSYSCYQPCRSQCGNSCYFPFNANQPYSYPYSNYSQYNYGSTYPSQTNYYPGNNGYSGYIPRIPYYPYSYQNYPSLNYPTGYNTTPYYQGSNSSNPYVPWGYSWPSSYNQTGPYYRPFSQTVTVPVNRQYIPRGVISSPKSH